MNELAEVISEAIKGNQQTGSDYTAKVTRVEGSTAYVRITGSDIADTPVAMSVSAKAGDMVRVRVANGKAWITGNDSSPPTDDSAALQAIKEIRETNELIKAKAKASDGRYSKIEQSVDEIVLEVGEVDTKASNAQATANGRMKADMSNKSSSIVIGSGTMTFNSNTLVVNSTKFKLDANGNATFAGSLNAATGSFAGSVSFRWILSANAYANVYIGDATKNAPIYMVAPLLGPAETFIQAGDISVYSGSTYYQITPYGPSSGSDRRIKRNIAEIGADIAKRLRPVSFNYVGDDTQKVHYGFIAQEVEPVLPSTVSEGRDGYLSLNYQELIAPLYALVLEQEKRIAQLEERLQRLEGNK
jgi:hypothetical protein